MSADRSRSAYDLEPVNPDLQRPRIDARVRPWLGKTGDVTIISGCDDDKASRVYDQKLMLEIELSRDQAAPSRHEHEKHRSPCRPLDLMPDVEVHDGSRPKTTPVVRSQKIHMECYVHLTEESEISQFEKWRPTHL